MARKSRIRRSLALVLACLALVAASVGVTATAVSARPVPNPDQAQLLGFRLPKDDGQAVFPNKMNYAQHAATPGPLLLFLPATGAQPWDYRSFLKTAVASGYDVLGLDYWNRGRSVVRTCGGDSECYTAVQQNRFDGSNPSAVSSVNPANSILTRLRVALTHLDASDPAGDWGRYMTGDQINWSRIVLAGHSQGGGESAYIAHLHLVHGVLMFSSPVETNEGVPAAWMRTPGATPASRMYGFVNSHDMYVDKIVGSWKELKLSSGKKSATAAVPTGSHQLVSTMDVGTALESHGKTVGDGTPRDSSGVPLFQPTWNWMLRQTLY